MDGLGGEESGIETPVICENIDKVTLQNCIVDDLFITNDISNNIIPISEDWTWDTILHANFNGNLLGGNIDITLDQINYITVKYREYGKTSWIKLIDVPISKSDDLSFERYCKWCRGNDTSYDFALVPVSPSGVEGNYNINTIISNFNDLFIMSKDKTFHGINETITPTRNQNITVLKPLSGKYPILISNDELDYNTLSVKCMFITTENNIYDKLGAGKYRQQAIDLLNSKIPLLIKMYDGRMWLIGVTDNISDDASNYNYERYTMTSFNVCEIGDANNEDDLRDNGLID